MADYFLLDDEKLVDLIKQDDNQAMNELAERYMNVAKTIATKFLDNKHYVDMSDFVQEGMLGFLSAVYSYNENDKKSKASFRTYAGVCIYNKMLSFAKVLNAKKKVPVNLCQSLDDKLDLVDTSLTPEEVMISNQEFEKMSEMIAKLLSKQEALVFSLYLSGHSYEEMSQSTDLSKKSIDTTLQRARTKLRSKFKNEI